MDISATMLPVTVLFFLARTGLGTTTRIEEYCLSQGECISSNDALPAYERFQNETDNCCMSCQCSHECVYFGDCCSFPLPPDVHCYRPLTNDRLNNILADQTSIFAVMVLSYQVISYCPDNIDSDVKYMCQEKEAEYPDELLPVATRNGILYKNKYCAMCNSYQEYTSWYLGLYCNNFDIGVSYESSKPFSHYSECIFWGQPKNEDLSKRFRCVSPVPNGCNEVTVAYHFSILAEDICSFSFYGMPTYSETYMYLLYKDDRCYFVNALLPFYQMNVNFEFTAVMNPAQRSFGEVKTKICAEMERYDPIFNKCRKMTCSLLSLPDFGHCRNIFDSVTGTNLRVVYVMNGLISDELTNQILNDYELPILSVINEALVYKATCATCQTVVWRKPNKNRQLDVALEILYLPTKYCDMTYLQDHMVNISSPVEVRVKQDIIKLTVLPGNTDLLSDGYEVVLPPIPDVCAYETIDFNRGLSCSRFELSQGEYETLRTIRNTLPQPYLVDTRNTSTSKIYAFCIDDYMVIAGAHRPFLAAGQLITCCCIFFLKRFVY